MQRMNGQIFNYSETRIKMELLEEVAREFLRDHSDIKTLFQRPPRIKSCNCRHCLMARKALGELGPIYENNFPRQDKQKVGAPCFEK